MTVPVQEELLNPVPIRLCLSRVSFIISRALSDRYYSVSALHSGAMGTGTSAVPVVEGSLQPTGFFLSSPLYSEV